MIVNVECTKMYIYDLQGNHIKLERDNFLFIAEFQKKWMRNRGNGFHPNNSGNYVMGINSTGNFCWIHIDGIYINENCHINLLICIPLIYVPFDRKTN